MPPSVKGKMYRHLFESQKNNRKKPALHFVGRDITYGQLFNEVEALCCAFRKYGCKKGDIVTIALPNIPSAVTLFYAVNKLGMTANLVHPLLPAEQIIRYATETKSKFLFVFDKLADGYISKLLDCPDVLCNREIKFGPFLDKAKEIGADFIATGHYCGISHVDGVHRLLKAADSGKDQTYFLNNLSQKQLADVLFPLGSLDKKEVRQIAQTEGLSTAEKKDSTGICFIGERNFRSFLAEYLPGKAGDIVDLSGRVVGRHDGLMYYTLGQRRGLGLGGTRESQNRWFVADKDLKNNRLVVSHGDESVLMSDALESDEINWIPFPPKEEKFECAAKFRYRQPEQRVTVERTGSGARVLFHSPQRAVTPGQYVVFYNEKECLGGGVIERVYKRKDGILTPM